MKNSRDAKKADKTTTQKATLEGRKLKSRVNVELKKNNSMPPLKYDEAYRQYIIPKYANAVIRFKIYLGSAEIRMARHYDGELSITPPPHCAWDIEVKMTDGYGNESDPAIYYTRKISD